jgi:CheY-like chemotaxis protein
MNKKSVLIVEDHESFSHMLKDFFEETFPELDTIWFSSPVKALEFCRKNPNLRIIGVLSDIMMKEMDGIDFLSSFRSLKSFRHIPFYFVSGTEPLVFEDHLRPLSHNGFLEKPINLDHLEHVVRSQMISKSRQVA